MGESAPKSSAFLALCDHHGCERSSVSTAGRATPEKSLVTARLFSDDGISVGDELFIIEKNHLITGRIRVTNVYNTVSLGCMLTGTGNFRSCSLRDRVVQLRSEE